MDKMEFEDFDNINYSKDHRNIAIYASDIGEDEPGLVLVFQNDALVGYIIWNDFEKEWGFCQEIDPSNYWMFNEDLDKLFNGISEYYEGNNVTFKRLNFDTRYNYGIKH